MRFKVVHRARGKLKPGVFAVGSLIRDEFRMLDSSHVLFHSTCGSALVVVSSQMGCLDLRRLFG